MKRLLLILFSALLLAGCATHRNMTACSINEEMQQVYVLQKDVFVAPSLQGNGLSTYTPLSTSAVPVSVEDYYAHPHDWMTSEEYEKYHIVYPAPGDLDYLTMALNGKKFPSEPQKMCRYVQRGPGGAIFDYLMYPAEFRRLRSTDHSHYFFYKILGVLKKGTLIQPSHRFCRTDKYSNPGYSVIATTNASGFEGQFINISDLCMYEDDIAISLPDPVYLKLLTDDQTD